MRRDRGVESSSRRAATVILAFSLGATGCPLADLTTGSAPSPADAGDDRDSSDAAPVPLAFIQVNSANLGAVTSGSLAFVNDVTPHATLIVAAVYGTDSSTGPTLVGLTDTQGNTFRIVVGPVDGPFRAGIWTAVDVLGGADKITFNVTLPSGAPGAASKFFLIHLHEYVGVAAFDVGGFSVGSGIALTSETVTTTGRNELVFGFGVALGGVGPGIKDGFSQRSALTNNYADDCSEDRFVDASGPYAATATNGSATPWMMLTAAFRGYR
jgi:hypothetical protein